MQQGMEAGSEGFSLGSSIEGQEEHGHMSRHASLSGHRFYFFCVSWIIMDNSLVCTTPQLGVSLLGGSTLGYCTLGDLTSMDHVLTFHVS